MSNITRCSTSLDKSFPASLFVSGQIRTRLRSLCSLKHAPLLPRISSSLPLAPPPARDASPPRGQRTTTEQRWSRRCDAQRQPQCSAHLACKLGIGRDTVARHPLFATTPLALANQRCAKREAARDDRGGGHTQIAVFSRVRPFSPPRAIRRALNLEVSPRTIDRRLQEAGLFGRVAQCKRDYSEGELKKRLSFAEGYAHWTVNDWSKVLFSNEKIFWGKVQQHTLAQSRESADSRFSETLFCLFYSRPLRIPLSRSSHSTA